MKLLKKSLACILSVMLLLTCIPLSALAATSVSVNVVQVDDGLGGYDDKLEVIVNSIDSSESMVHAIDDAITIANSYSGYSGTFTDADIIKLTVGSGVVLNANDLDAIADYATAAGAVIPAITTATTGLTGLEELDLSVASLPAGVPAYQFDATSVTATALETVKLPANTSSIGNSAFNGQANLESVNFNQLTSLSAIEASAFAGTALTTVDLSGSTTLATIGANAFSTSTLTSIDLSGLTNPVSIANNAFFGATNLRTVDLSGSPVATVGGTAVFNGNANNEVYVIIDSANKATYTSNASWRTMTVTGSGDAYFTYVGAPQNVTVEGTGTNRITFTWTEPVPFDTAGFTTSTTTVAEVNYQISLDGGATWESRYVDLGSQTGPNYSITLTDSTLVPTYSVHQFAIRVVVRDSLGNDFYSAQGVPDDDDFEDEVLVVPTAAEAVTIDTDLKQASEAITQGDASTVTTASAALTDDITYQIPANLVQAFTYPTGSPLTVGNVDYEDDDFGELTWQWYYSTSDTLDLSTATPVGSVTTVAPAAAGTVTIDTSATITLDETLAVGEYYYFVVFTNTNPLAYDSTAQTTITKSDYVKITVVDPNASKAPVIDPHPQGYDYYVLNETATAMTVGATSPDSGTITYYWKKTDLMLGGSAYMATGTSETSYIPATDRYGEFQYYVDVENDSTLASGATTLSSKTAYIIVKPEAPVLDGPSGADYQLGDTASDLAVTATVGDGGTLSYQWYQCDADGSNPVAVGTDSASYTPDITTIGEYYYYVEVNNHNKETTSYPVGGVGTRGSEGDNTVTSAIVRVSVGGVDADTPVLGSVTDESVITNDPVTLTAPTVSGVTTGTVTYQWYSCDDTSHTNPVEITGETGTTYTPDTSVVGTYYYFVAVTNTDTTATGAQQVTVNSDVYTVTVSDPVTDAETPVVTGPADVSCDINDVEALSVTVDPLTSPTAVVSYQWYSCDDAAGTNPQIITGETNDTLDLDTSVAGTYYYFVKVTNDDSTATNTKTVTVDSRVATVTVTDPTPLVDAETPNITADPADAAYVVNDTGVVDLTVVVDPVTSGTLTYQWYSCDDASGTNAVAITGANGDTYTPDVSTAGTYYYFVEVTNTDTTATGNQTATENSAVATVTVTDPTGIDAEEPVITKDPESTAYEVNAATVDPLTVEVDPVTSGTVSYQWYSCDDADGTNPVAIPGANSDSYTPDVSTAGTYYYFVEVTNTDTSATGNQTASVNSEVATVNVASEFTVTFMDGDEVLGSVTVAVNDTVAEPADPEKEGHVFTGWYTDAECTEAYDFDAPVISDLVLYAGWEEMEDHFAYAFGYTDGTFGPNNSITRAEAAQLFHNLMGNPDPSTVSGTYTGYTDVNDSGWYAKAVQTLSKLGVIKGDPAGTFRPNDTITRAEFASMIQLFYGLDDGTTTNFPDIDGHWAWTAITAIEEAGYSVGDTAGNYNPNKNITRAESVTMLNMAEGRYTSNELWTESGIESPFSDVTSPDDHWGYSQIMEAGVDHYHWYATEEAAE